MAKHAPPPSPFRRALASLLAWRPSWPPAPFLLVIASAALVVVSVVALVVAPHPHVDTRPPIDATPSSARAEGTRTFPRYSPAVIPSIDASGAYNPDAPTRSSSSSATRTTSSRTRTAPAASTTAAPSSTVTTPSSRRPTSAQPPPDPDPVVVPQPQAGTPLIELVNRDRLANGCGPVTVDPTLMSQSQTWSEQQAHDDWMRHSAGGFGGENVAAGQRTADEVHADWMASPGHRANILNCGFTRIGYGVADSAIDVRYWTEQLA